MVSESMKERVALLEAILSMTETEQEILRESIAEVHRRRRAEHERHDLPLIQKTSE